MTSLKKSLKSSSRRSHYMSVWQIHFCVTIYVDDQVPCKCIETRFLKTVFLNNVIGAHTHQ